MFRAESFCLSPLRFPHFPFPSDIFTVDFFKIKPDYGASIPPRWRDWPDKGVPKTVANIYDFVLATRSAGARLSGPVVVHCSAGVGRTGCLLAVDLCMQQVCKKPRIDICFVCTFVCISYILYCKLLSLCHSTSISPSPSLHLSLSLYFAHLSPPHM